MQKWKPRKCDDCGGIGHVRPIVAELVSWCHRMTSTRRPEVPRFLSHLEFLRVLDHLTHLPYVSCRDDAWASATFVATAVFALFALTMAGCVFPAALRRRAHFGAIFPCARRLFGKKQKPTMRDLPTNTASSLHGATVNVTTGGCPFCRETIRSRRTAASARRPCSVLQSSPAQNDNY